MNEILKIVLSLSLSGSLLILVLLLCKPLFKNRISKHWQYYIWLVVIARLLLPFTPDVSLVGILFQEVDRAIVQMNVPPTPEQNTGPTPQSGSDTVIKDDIPPHSEETPITTPPTAQRVLTITLQNLWLVWLVVALILLIRKITIYQGFVKYIKAGRTEISDPAILDRLALIGEQAGIKKPVELYTNDLISSPLLIGFFRPYIVLPTTDLPDIDFQYIIRHELTHHRRRDMFYKWLVQLTICLHWFNPLVYLMGHEVNRVCELACDEAVIKKLDKNEQRAYGDTLIHAIRIGGDYNDSLASITLNESKERLKERLDAIMKYKRMSNVMVAVTLAITLLMATGAVAMGAYAKAQMPTTPNSDSMESPATTPIPASALKDFEPDSVKSITLAADSCGIELVKSQNGKFTFDYLGVEDITKFKVNYTITADGILQIAVDGAAARAAVGHYYIENRPNYSNVVRIGIPDKEYKNITLTLDGAPATLPDFKATVGIEADDSSISISDTEISKGIYHINNLSGSVSFMATTLSSNISIVNEGECKLIFNQMPQNLALDVSECRGQIMLPAGWTNTYRLGNGTPTVKINNHGYTQVIISN